MRCRRCMQLMADQVSTWVRWGYEDEMGMKTMTATRWDWVRWETSDQFQLIRLLDTDSDAVDDVDAVKALNVLTMSTNRKSKEADQTKSDQKKEDVPKLANGRPTCRRASKTTNTKYSRQCTSTTCQKVQKSPAIISNNTPYSKGLLAKRCRVCSLFSWQSGHCVACRRASKDRVRKCTSGRVSPLSPVIDGCTK